MTGIVEKAIVSILNAATRVLQRSTNAMREFRRRKDSTMTETNEIESESAAPMTM